ncbi:MAG TPA: cytochrome C biogenesis protein CcdA [Rhodobacteraceae bacterium]|nr:cytochrome C biogenesis protein CcdA [Paracoccaceae bacterium]
MKRLILIFALLATPVFAVQPDEILDDPALETRARALGQELKCVVCQGESIDESNAGIARDLRLLVRERLVKGETDQDVLDFVVARYGEYVLMRPTWTGSNIILYVAGPVMLLLALLAGLLFFRRRALAGDVAPDALSKDEQDRLAELMKE